MRPRPAANRARKCTPLSSRYIVITGNVDADLRSGARIAHPQMIRQARNPKRVTPTAPIKIIVLLTGHFRKKKKKARSGRGGRAWMPASHEFLLSSRSRPKDFYQEPNHEWSSANAALIKMTKTYSETRHRRRTNHHQHIYSAPSAAVGRRKKWEVILQQGLAARQGQRSAKSKAGFPRTSSMEKEQIRCRGSNSFATKSCDHAAQSRWAGLFWVVRAQRPVEFRRGPSRSGSAEKKRRGSTGLSGEFRTGWRSKGDRSLGPPPRTAGI